MEFYQSAEKYVQYKHFRRHIWVKKYSIEFSEK